MKILCLLFLAFCQGLCAIPLYYWDARPTQGFSNFGDELSVKLVERMIGHEIEIASNPLLPQQKLLALGSILNYALDDDVIWGTGVNGKYLKPSDYHFSRLDVRAVRGPLTRQFLLDLGVDCPEIYGDPTLLLPLLFPEFQRSSQPSREYVVIPHYADECLFPQEPNMVSVREPWNEVIEKILTSKFVIASALSGVIVAEAFGIPARLLRVSEKEDLFKYRDYYYGTGRFQFDYATSIEQALQMGGEAPPICNLECLYRTFPLELFDE